MLQQLVSLFSYYFFCYNHRVYKGDFLMEIKGLGVFNPFSKEFKQAQKVFYEDLSDGERAIAVFAAIIGGPFFIVGGFAAFCWTVRALQSSDSSNSLGSTSKKVSHTANSILQTA